MSWLYSQVLVEEYLGENFSDGEQSAPLNGNPIQQAYCAPGKMTDFSRLSRFGMTYKPLTESRGEELLTLYLAVFHAKTFLLQEKEQELMENEVECGATCQELLAKYDPNLHLLKTVQCSFLEDSTKSSVTLPKSGMTRNGLLWELQMLEPITKETEYGFLLPTPTCHNSKEGAYPAEYKRKTASLAIHVGGKIHPMFTEWMMGWPLGWTDLKPLETGKFHFAPQQLGEC
jgi:hypothetical protein